MRCGIGHVMGRLRAGSVGCGKVESEVVMMVVMVVSACAGEFRRGCMNLYEFRFVKFAGVICKSQTRDYEMKS